MSMVLVLLKIVRNIMMIVRQFLGRDSFFFWKNRWRVFSRHMIMRELAPTLCIPYPLVYQLEDPPFVPTAFGTRMELRCVIAVIRHGDRTPKQKMKMVVLHPL